MHSVQIPLLSIVLQFAVALVLDPEPVLDPDKLEPELDPEELLLDEDELDWKLLLLPPSELDCPSGLNCQEALPAGLLTTDVDDGWLEVVVVW